jgi:mannose-6-phosphate isomerase-like protein (cupin superfamily)
MASTEVRVKGQVIYDDRPNTGEPINLDKNQKLKTKGWQVTSIPGNIPPELKTGTAYVQMTDNRYAKCVINVYGPGESDEMHCHPGSEHIFMVFQGELHIRGINENEEITLKPGELVHINQSYFYQLHNPTDGVTVLYQVATKPPKPSKVRQYNYRGPADTIDPTLLEGE